MQVLKIAEVGDITIRKLSKRDWEYIRNECLVIDPVKRIEKSDTGSFIKYLIIFGVSKSPFFKSVYDTKRLDASIILERENEYYDSEIPQVVFDTIFSEIKKYNDVNVSEIKEVSKE